MTNEKRKTVLSLPPNSLHFNVRHDRHARRHQMLWIDLVWLKDDLDGDPLDDFHVTTGRVLRRNQTEPRARAGLNTVHMCLESPVGVSIDANLHRLARSNLSNLTLLEVRGYPDIAGNYGHHRLAHF